MRLHKALANGLTPTALRLVNVRYGSDLWHSLHTYRYHRPDTASHSPHYHDDCMVISGTCLIDLEKPRILGTNWS